MSVARTGCVSETRQHVSSNSKGELNQEDDDNLHSHGHGRLSWSDFSLLSWSSIGVIFGDIATSPLYVYKSIFVDLVPDGQPREADVMGSSSLIFWTLTLVVMVKYIGVVLGADDQGQGGTFALYSLLCRNMGIKPHGARGPAMAAAGKRSREPAASTASTPTMSPVLPTTAAGAGAGSGGAGGVGSSGGGGGGGGGVGSSGGGEDRSSVSGSDTDGDVAAVRRNGQMRPWWRWGAVRKEWFGELFRRSRRAQMGLWAVAVVATAMLMGDGVLTPAMSVLSAVSGLSEVVPGLNQDVIIGVTIVVLVLVFAIQPMGTGQVGIFFAPIIAIWLLANAAINCFNLAKQGGAVFAAINPAHIVTYFRRHGATAWRSLGAVMLSVTGAEALFADLGHFSRGSISVAFAVLAYPCLIVTYFGQAAHVIAHPQDTDVFWKSLPRPLTYPMLILATLATIVASQALISGLFSIIRQAMILGAFPPARIVHTGGKNPAHATQVYIPLVNVVLFALCCIVVGGFKDTVALGKAYGLAVMTDMMTTTCLVTLVMLTVWEVSLLLVVPFFGLFLVLEGGYWSANIIKVPQGGWFTITVAAVVSAIMLIWWAGNRRLGERLTAITAGAHIRLLGCPQPPPLLQQPLSPVPPLSFIGGAGSSNSASVANPRRLLYRLASWALPPPVLLRRKAADTGSNGSRTMAVAPYPALPGVVRATSLPLPRLESRTSLSQRIRTAAATRSVPLGQMRKAILEEGEEGPLSSSSSSAAVPPVGHLASLAAAAAAVAEPLASPTQLYGDRGVGGRNRKAAVVSESSFAPGTLALVLPADEFQVVGGGAAPGASAPASAATANGVAILLDGGGDSDVEMGGSAATAALLPPVVVPLTARLPGIGVYYMDEKVGGANSALTTLPPVLVHFLRNVQAIHDVCIFLSVRNLPTPSVSRRHRLQVYTPLCVSAPNFYQVVARYGYLDVIDHGPAFISELVDAVLRRLVAVEARAARGRLPPTFRSASFQTFHSHELSPFLERDETAAATDELKNKPLARMGQHNPIDMAHLARSSRMNSGNSSRGPGGVSAASMPQAVSAAAEVVAGSAELAVASRRQPGDAAAAAPAGPTAAGMAAAVAAHNSALEAARAQVEEAVAAFLEARLHGVVYYSSRALTRVDEQPGRFWFLQYINWFLYGLLYRWLAAIAYVDMERWRVPSQQIVELGMPVYI